MAICSKCGEDKPQDAFYKQSGGRGFMRNCKTCFQQVANDWYQRHRKHRNARAVLVRRARQLGMTIADYIAKGEPALACEICGAEPSHERNGMHRSGSSPIAKAKRLAVDHDHETGARRGLLCSHCNRAIGLAGDDPKRLKKMARYIEKYRLPA